MGTHSLLATAGIATIGVATAGLLAAGLVGGQEVASASTDRTLTAHETFTTTVAQDFGAKGLTPGDRLVFKTEVRDLKGRKLGIGTGDCVLLSGTSDASALYNCLETYRLSANDHVMTSGVFDGAPKINKWAIIGGTGRYRGATGQVDFTQPDAAGTFVDTFRFGS